MRIKYLLCPIVAGIVFFLMADARAEMSKGIVVGNAWVQAMPPSQKTSAAYMSIVNDSPQEAVIVSVSSDIAGATEIHQMSQMNGMMHMAMQADLHIPAHGKVVLQPGGFHIMLINLKKPVTKGTIVPMTLHFQDGGTVRVNADARDQ